MAPYRYFDLDFGDTAEISTGVGDEVAILGHQGGAPSCVAWSTEKELE